MPPYHVKAEWDAEAEVWVASSDDVPASRPAPTHSRLWSRS